MEIKFRAPHADDVRAWLPFDEPTLSPVARRSMAWRSRLISARGRVLASARPSVVKGGSMLPCSLGAHVSSFEALPDMSGDLPRIVDQS